MNSEILKVKAEMAKPGRNAVGWVAVPAAYLMMAMLLRWPETAAQAAKAAMEMWYRSVVPALFPFMMLMPLITGQEAAHIYEKMLGRIMGVIFRLPGAAAPAIVTGMIAGSPAGAIAAGRAAEYAGMDRRQLVRIAGSMCGFSPAFLITGIGTGMMGNINAGIMLMKTQLCAQLIMLAATRGYSGGEKIHVVAQDENAAGAAVIPILTVAGYMVFFSVIAALITRLTGEGVWNGIICILEVTAGAGFVAGIHMNYETKMVILAGMCGFGGISTFAQNMKILTKYGILPLQFMKWRLSGALVSAAVMYGQLYLGNRVNPIIQPDWMNLAAFFVVILVIPVLISLKKSIS